MRASGPQSGLGAIWKFPYMAGAEGGAAFLIPYIIFSFTLAFGLLLAETRSAKREKEALLPPIGISEALSGQYSDIWVY